MKFNAAAVTAATVAALATVGTVPPTALAAPATDGHGVHARDAVKSTHISVINQTPGATITVATDRDPYNPETLVPGQHGQYYSGATRWSDTNTQLTVTVRNYPTQNMPNGDPNVYCKMFCHNRQMHYPTCKVDCFQTGSDGKDYSYAWLVETKFSENECHFLLYGDYQMGHVCRANDEPDNKHFDLYVYAPGTVRLSGAAPDAATAAAAATAPAPPPQLLMQGGDAPAVAAYGADLNAAQGAADLAAPLAPQQQQDMIFAGNAAADSGAATQSISLL